MQLELVEGGTGEVGWEHDGHVGREHDFNVVSLWDGERRSEFYNVVHNTRLTVD